MADEGVPDLMSADTSEEDEDEDEDDGMPPLTSSTAGDDPDVPPASSSLDNPSEDDDEDDDDGSASGSDSECAGPVSLPVERAAAPYSQPGNMKEEGPSALIRKKQAARTVVVDTEPRPQIVQEVQQQATEATTGTGVSEDVALASTAAAPAVKHESIAKFQEREKEHLDRLRKERGFADNDGLSHMVFARCHLRPGARCTKLCEHDAGLFFIKCADRRIVVECTKGCRMYYHYPNCWRRVTKAYKEDVDPNWSTWSTKSKEPQLVPCITDQCSGYICSAVVEGPSGEDTTTREQQYSMPKELREQLDRKRLQDAEELKKSKLEALRIEQERNKLIRRQRKDAAAAARAASKGSSSHSHAANGASEQHQDAQGGWQAASKARIKAAPAPQPKQPGIKIYNTAKAVESAWSPPAAGTDVAVEALPPPPEQESQLSESEFPSLTSRAGPEADTNGAGQKAKSKKKVKMVPLDPRSLGFTQGDEYSSNQYQEEYYSEPSPNDAQLAALERTYPHFERDNYGNPLFPDDTWIALDRLRVDHQRGIVTNHLLVEYLDIAKLVQATNRNVDSFLKDAFSAFKGFIMHFRIFTFQEAAAISFSTVDQAVMAYCRMNGQLMHRNVLTISFLLDFPNDNALLRVLPSYVPTRGKPAQIKNVKTTCHVKYVPFSEVQAMADMSDEAVREELHRYPVRTVQDASDNGIPDIDPRNTYYRPAPRKPAAALPPPAAPMPLLARAAPPAPASEAGSSSLSGSAVEEPPEDDHAPTADAVLPAPSAQSSFEAPSQLELQFDVVQVLGCKSDHLDAHYRRYPAFKLEHRFFCDPHRIASSPSERTALALCNIDTRRLEGLWEAVSNNGREVDFKPVANMPALPFEAYAPLLPPILLQSSTNSPMKVPARLDGHHARFILQAFARAQAAAAPPPTPTALPIPLPNPALRGPQPAPPQDPPRAAQDAPPAASASAPTPQTDPHPPAATAAAATSRSPAPAEPAAPPSRPPHTSAPPSPLPPSASSTPSSQSRATTPSTDTPPTPTTPIISPPPNTPAPIPPSLAHLTAPTAPQTTPVLAALAQSVSSHPLIPQARLMYNPAYNPMAPRPAYAAAPAAAPLSLQPPLAAAPLGPRPPHRPAAPAAPRPTRDVSNIFPFLLRPNNGPPQNQALRPNIVLQPVSIFTAPTANPPSYPGLSHLHNLPSYPPAARPTANSLPQPPAPHNPFPYLTSSLPPAVPASPTIASPLPPSPVPPSPSPVPPSHSPSPAASPSPIPPAPAPRKKVRHSCPLCGTRKFRYLHTPCKGYGPCTHCMPDEGLRASVYPVCLSCNQPTSDTDLQKVHW